MASLTTTIITYTRAKHEEVVKQDKEDISGINDKKA